MFEATMKVETHHFDRKAKYVCLACFKHIAFSLCALISLMFTDKIKQIIVLIAVR